LTAIASAKPASAVTDADRLQRDKFTKPLSDVRLMHEDDIHWALALARRRYADTWDFIGAEGWFRNVVCKSPMVFLPIRSEDAFLIAMVSVVPWLPARWECNIVMFCADDGKMWQGLALMRASIAWARQRRCVEWRVSSETDIDLGPLAKRLGAEELSPRYRMRLDG